LLPPFPTALRPRKSKEERKKHLEGKPKQ
jgi:hypothetical protein